MPFTDDTTSRQIREPRQSFSAFMASLKSLNLYICRVSPVTWWNSVISTRCEHNRANRGRVIANSIFDLGEWPWALGSGINFAKFNLRQLIRASIIEIFMLIRYVTLWPWRLIRWPWKFVVHQKASRLARFRRAILGGRRMGHFYRTVLGCVDPTSRNLVRTYIKPSSLHKKFVSEFGYLAAFSNASGSNLSDVENDANFRTFWLLWKYQLLKVYLRLNLRNTFIHCTAYERGVLIKNNERKFIIKT